MLKDTVSKLDPDTSDSNFHTFNNYAIMQNFSLFLRHLELMYNATFKTIFTISTCKILMTFSQIVNFKIGIHSDI